MPEDEWVGVRRSGLGASGLRLRGGSGFGFWGLGFGR